MGWIDQLIDQEFLRREGEYRVIKIAADGLHLLRGNAEAVLYDDGSARAPARPKRKKTRKSRSSSSTSRSRVSDDMKQALTRKSGASSSEPAAPLSLDERQLFDRLRALRREIADDENIPAFMVCSDRTLREIARKRPASRGALLAVKGIGPAKVEAFGERMLRLIND